MIHPVMTQMAVRLSTRTVICKNCKVARLVQKSPKPVGDLGERDQLTRRGFSSEGLGFGWGWENGCIRTPTCRKVKGVGINQKIDRMISVLDRVRRIDPKDGDQLTIGRGLRRTGFATNRRKDSACFFQRPLHRPGLNSF